MSNYRKNSFFHGVDLGVFFNLIIIMLLGLLLLASAGSVVAGKLGLPEHHFLKKQLIFLFIGILIIIFISNLSEKCIRRLIFLGFVITVILLLLVLFLGEITKGAKRWITLCGFSMQPSEFLKPFYTSFIAIILSSEKDKFNTKNFYICIVLNCLIVTLLLLQPDFGMTVTNTIATFSLLFIAGIKLSWLLIILILSFFGFYAAYISLPHVAERINKFFTPASMSNYQVHKSMSSYLKGGFIGKGPGEGTIKYLLPDAHTDFIFAVGAEEYGLVFCIIIILAFAIFIFKGLLSTTYMNNLFHIYTIFGVILHFTMQFILNIGVTLNIFPTKGVTLPFISYGGSSIIAFSISVGIYLNLLKTRKLNSVSSKGRFIYIEEELSE